MGNSPPVALHESIGLESAEDDAISDLLVGGSCGKLGWAGVMDSKWGKDINEYEKKFKMLAHDEEIARKVQEDWEAEESFKKKREREQFTMEERAKFLHDTIATQRRFHAEQRAAAIRNRPPIRTQLLVFDESFTVIGSIKDERKIKEMNEGASDPDKKKIVFKEDVYLRRPMELRAFNYPIGRYYISLTSKDLLLLYGLVMKLMYSQVLLWEGIELILWGDLKIMMESSTEENDQSISPTMEFAAKNACDFGLEVIRLERTACLDLIRCSHPTLAFLVKSW
ncbi:hypothetical protein Tco_0391191 [Tanacetum coccineum]